MGSRHRPLVAAVAGGALVCALAPAASADVTGTITLTGTAGKPPERGKAFLTRTENPLVPVKTVDPMPQLVVVLSKDGTELPASPQVQWELLGDSFDRPLLPVTAGTEVVIHNKSRRSPSLIVPGTELLPNTPLDPKVKRPFKATEPGLLTVVDEDAPHVTGAVLVLDTPYFAMPDKNGKFAIADVPDGTYAVRVWYQTGWLDGADTTVTVEKGKAKLDLKLPPGLKLAGAAGK